MKIGFLGTGHITSSVIQGIFKSNLRINKIYVSPRNKSISKKLSKKFKKVSIAKNNQELIDLTNWVFLAVTPKVAHKILKTLVFAFKVEERTEKNNAEAKNNFFKLNISLFN